jgi:hypothetical protein
VTSSFLSSSWATGRSPASRSDGSSARIQIEDVRGVNYVAPSRLALQLFRGDHSERAAPLSAGTIKLMRSKE